MKDLLQILRNGLKAVGIVLAGLILIASLIAPPKVVLLDVTNTTAAHISYDGLPILPSATGARFVFMGRSDVYVTADAFETAHVRFGRTADVFRGSVDVSKWLGFLFLADVRLMEKDPNLRCVRYRGALTAGGEEVPQVLPIHPGYSVNPLDYLRRRYENETGRSFDSVEYVQLVEAEGSGEIHLDFSTAKGGAVEYVPPADWGHGNLAMRVVQSMTEPPIQGYPARLLIHQSATDTPYGMGTTFFYCMIAGHYCAGTVTPSYDSRGRRQAWVELWQNSVEGDPRLRYP